MKTANKERENSKRTIDFSYNEVHKDREEIIRNREDEKDKI